MFQVFSGPGANVILWRIAECVTFMMIICLVYDHAIKENDTVEPLWQRLERVHEESIYFKIKFVNNVLS